MGCTNSNAIVDETTVKQTDGDFLLMLQQVRDTWPEVQKIDDFGAKTFAHLLKKYPELKPIYHVPEAYKHGVDLLNAKEVKEAGEKFIAQYSDIVKNSGNKFDETIRAKAAELNRQGVKPTQMKYYGESLAHVIVYELGDRLNSEEKHAWRFFSNHVSTALALEMSKQSKVTHS